MAAGTDDDKVTVVDLDCDIKCARPTECNGEEWRTFLATPLSSQDAVGRIESLRLGPVLDALLDALAVHRLVAYSFSMRHSTAWAGIWATLRKVVPSEQRVK